MALQPLPFLATSKLRIAFLVAFWTVSALAFFTRIARFSNAFSMVACGLLGLGFGVVLVVVAEPHTRLIRRHHGNRRPRPGSAGTRA